MIYLTNQEKALILKNTLQSQTLISPITKPIIMIMKMIAKNQKWKQQKMNKNIRKHLINHNSQKTDMQTQKNFLEEIANNIKMRIIKIKMKTSKRKQMKIYNNKSHGIGLKIKKRMRKMNQNKKITYKIFNKKTKYIIKSMSNLRLTRKNYFRRIEALKVVLEVKKIK